MVIKGLHTDARPEDQPQGTYRYAKNIVINKDLQAVVSEMGTTEVDEIGAGYTIIGQRVMHDDTLILISTNGTTTLIGRLSAGTYTNDFTSNALNTSVQFPITDLEYWINSQNETVIYFTDDNNPPRFLNLDQASLTTDVNYMNVFPYVGTVPEFNITSISENGGNLASGSYYLAVAYVHQDGTPTDYFISGNIIIPNEKELVGFTGVDGAEAGTSTSKAINIQLSNLDHVGYNRLRLAYIPSQNGVLMAPRVLDDIYFDGQILDFKLTGAETYTESTLDDIIIPRPVYDTAKTIKIYDRSLYMANLTQAPDIGFQPYANNITVNYTSKYVPNHLDAVSGSHKDPSTVYNQKHFRSSEVYAFYISLVLKDGRETMAYHIPGRAIGPNATGTDENGDVSNVAFYLQPQATEFALLGGSPKVHECFALPGNNGMAYWENRNEYYPNTNDWLVLDENGNQVDDLRQSKVRHHKFPTYGADEVYKDEETGVTLRGIYLTDVKFPAHIKSQIKGYRIHFAKRTQNNKTRIAQTVGVPVYRKTYSNGVFLAPALGNPHVKDWHAQLYQPFDLMISGEDVGNISYVEHLQLLYGRGTRRSTNTYIVNYTDTNPVVNSNAIRVVRAAAYASLNNDSTIGTSTLGFTGDGTSMNMSKSGVLVETKNLFGADGPAANWDSISIGTYKSDISREYLTDLCAYRTDVYRSFDSQELVWTGYYSTDLTTGTSGHIYGGDTYVGYVSSIYSRAQLDPTYPSGSGVVHYGMGVHRVTDGVEVDLSSYHTFDDFDNSSENYFRVAIGAVVESSYNVGMRHETGNWQEWYYPKSDYDTVFQLDVNHDNFYGFNPDYAQLNNLRPAIPYPKDYKPVTKLPTRVIRGTSQLNVSPDIDNIRTYLPNDYMDLQKNRGSITQLARVNSILVPHLERAVVRTTGKNQMSVDGDLAYVGSGDIFGREPEEFIVTETGYGGLQSIYGGIETEFGYFWVDQKAGKVFLLSSSIEEVSANGMRNYFAEHLPSYFSKNYGIEIDIPTAGIGVSVGFDPYLKRMFVTKQDKVPTAYFLSLFDPAAPARPTITWDEEVRKFKLTSGAYIDWSDVTYFTSQNWTVSYAPEYKYWVAWHDFTPAIYSNTAVDLFSANSGKMYKHGDASSVTRYYGQNYGMEFEFIFNAFQDKSMLFSAVGMYTQVQDPITQAEVYNKTFDKFVAFNDYQCSGYVDIVNKETARIRNRQWTLNGFRDKSDVVNTASYLNHEPTNIDANKSWYLQKKFTAKWFGIKLVYDNTDNNLLFLYNLDVKARPAYV